MQFSKQDCLFSLMWKHSRKVQNVVLTKLLRGKSRIICWVSSENLLEKAECGFVVKGRDHLLTNLWERQASHQTEKLEKFAKNKNLMDVKWSISIPLWNVPPGANFVEAGPEELEGDRHRSLLHRCHPLHRCSQVPPHQPSKMNFNICGNFFHGQNFICTHA